jgi:hypothetical protein
MGYGINANIFNANPGTYSPTATPVNTALAQSGSLTGQSYTPVARVVGLIDPYGNLNSSTALYNIFNTNNPRSAFSTDGSSYFYVSGQGTGSDATGGVFRVPTLASNSAPTAITGLDTTSNSIAQDTRTVQIYNNTLYVSVDSREGSGNNRSFVGTLGTPPATSVFNSSKGPTQLTTANNAATPVAVTSTGKLVLTASETNGINATGQTINLSPSNYFFASPSVLYIADTGSPKQTSATSLYGAGGLQKWVNTSANGTGTWQLQYTLYAGLNLVANSAAVPANTSGATGLYGLAGTVSGGTVYLYATNYNISDLDPTYLYGITDTLSTTANPGTAFTLLATAPADSNFKGVSFAPTLAAGSSTITSVPSGLAFTSAGTGCAPGTYTTPVTLLWTPGSSCTLSVASPQSSNATTYAFSNWQDGTTSTTDAVTAPSTAATYTATFTSNFAPFGNLDRAFDATTASTTIPQSDSLYVGGWAADAVDGASLASIKVLVDGTQIGTPTTGQSRPDVAAYYNNSAYTNSGYAFYYAASQLTPGSHAATVVATDSVGHSTTFGPLSFTVTTVNYPPVGNFDQAIGATSFSSTVSQSEYLYVNGWAASPQSTSSIASVQVMLDGAAIGNATLGQSRPDVTAYPNSGWSSYFNAATIQTGVHTVTAIATDSTGLTTMLGSKTITVTP